MKLGTDFRKNCILFLTLGFLICKTKGILLGGLIIRMKIVKCEAPCWCFVRGSFLSLIQLEAADLLFDLQPSQQHKP